MTHMSKKQFETINWLPIKERYNRCGISIFKYFNTQCSHFINEVFNAAPKSRLSLLRSEYQKTRERIRKRNTRQNLSLCQHCGRKSLKKSKEQLTSPESCLILRNIT